MHTALASVRAWFAGSVVLIAACSSGGVSSSPYPYKVGTTNVIGGTGSADGSSPVGVSGSSGPMVSTSRVGVAEVEAITTPSAADACIEIKDKCAKPQASCGDHGTADVIVGDDGAVLSVICYPDHDYDVVEVGDAPVKSPPLGNNTVLVLDDRDDGADIDGDLEIKGNNVIVYGHGPETSVIGGDLTIAKNNAIVRGVRIDGDVDISKNNASLVDCVIEGNLHISGNNVSLALCEIWGTLDITGNNTVLVSNLVHGDQPLAGDNLRCNDNHRFDDADGDMIVEDTELGDPVTCESRGTAVADMPGLTPKK